MVACSAEGCTFKTIYNKVLVQHIDKVHGSEKSHMCIQCGYATNYASQLDKHIETNHKTGQTYKCGECSFTSKNVRYVKQNVKKHEVLSEQQTLYYCDQCEYINEKPSLFQQHLFEEHICVGRWSCTECEYYAVTQTDVLSHIQSQHNGEGEPHKRHLVVRFNMDAFCRPSAEQDEWLKQQGPECQPKYVVIEYSNLEDVPYHDDVQTLTVDTGNEVVVETTCDKESDIDQKDEMRTNNNIYACAICGLADYSLENIQQHLSIVHNSDKCDAGINLNDTTHDVIVEVTDMVPDEVIIQEDMEAGEVVYEQTELVVDADSAGDMRDEAVSAAVESILNLQDTTITQ